MTLQKNSLRFALIVTGIFAGLLVSLLIGHELWRDEAQAWLIARDAPSLSVLCHQVRYDGTPPLWHLSLRALTHITHRPEIMQAFHGLLACLMLFLFCRFSPLSRLQCLLLPFNYYFLFQYGAVSRNYALGLLALSATCAVITTQKVRPWLVSALLITASLTSAHAWILALALGIAYFREERHVQPIGAWVLGLGLAVMLMLPASDTLFPSAVGWHLKWDGPRFMELTYRFMNAHLVLPNPHAVWETAWWDGWKGAQYAAPWISLLLLGSGIAAVKKNSMSLCFYVVGVLGLCCFLYMKYLGYSRHTGFLFFSFLFAYWLTRRPDARGSLLLTSLLIVQATGGILCAYQDMRAPFSLGQEAARELHAMNLDKAFIAVGPDYLGAPLAAYLERSLYYPQGRRWGSYTIWDRRRIEIFDDREFLKRTEEEAQQQAGSLVVAVDHPLDDRLLRQHKLKSLSIFEGCLVGDENYYLYAR